MAYQKTRADPFILRTCLHKWATSRELRWLSTSLALGTINYSRRRLRRPRNGENNTQMPRKFQTQRSLKLTILEILMVMTSLVQFVIRVNVAHAIPWPSFRPSRLDWSSSTANKCQCFPHNKLCSATSSTRAAKVAGHTWTHTSWSADTWSPMIVHPTREKQRDRHAQITNNAHLLPKFKLLSMLARVGAKFPKNKFSRKCLETDQFPLNSRLTSYSRLTTVASCLSKVLPSKLWTCRLLV